MSSSVRKKRACNAPGDRRVVRTRRRLAEALVTLVAERGYSRTTVKDVLDRADVGRTTFYAHYRSKDALFASALDRLEQELRAAAAAATDGRCLPFTRAMLDHIAAHRDATRSSPAPELEAVVLPRMRRMLVRLAREDLEARMSGSARARIDLIAEHAIGGFVALIAAWMRAPRPMDAGELDDLYRRLVLPGIEAALRD